jgi:hypothetical protein
MFDARPYIKNLWLVSSFIVCKEGTVIIVEDYDKRSSYLILLICYHYLHPMIEFDVGCVNQTTNATSNLNIFEQTLITNDLVKKISTRKLPIFKHY